MALKKTTNQQPLGKHQLSLEKEEEGEEATQDCPILLFLGLKREGRDSPQAFKFLLLDLATTEFNSPNGIYFCSGLPQKDDRILIWLTFISMGLSQNGSSPYYKGIYAIAGGRTAGNPYASKHNSDILWLTE